MSSGQWKQCKHGHVDPLRNKHGQCIPCLQVRFPWRYVPSARAEGRCRNGHVNPPRSKYGNCLLCSRAWQHKYRAEHLEEVRAYERMQYNKRSGKLARAEQGIFYICHGAEHHVNPPRGSDGHCLLCRQASDARARAKTVKGMKALWQNRKQLRALRKLLQALQQPTQEVSPSLQEELRTLGLMPS